MTNGAHHSSPCDQLITPTTDRCPVRFTGYAAQESGLRSARQWSAFPHAAVHGKWRQIMPPMLWQPPAAKHGLTRVENAFRGLHEWLEGAATTARGRHADVAGHKHPLLTGASACMDINSSVRSGLRLAQRNMRTNDFTTSDKRQDYLCRCTRQGTKALSLREDEVWLCTSDWILRHGMDSPALKLCWPIDNRCP